MKLIGGTFKEFLERNNMLILTPIFEASTTVQGYGNIHSTAALYGLLWNTPKFMNGFLDRLKGSQNSTGISIYNTLRCVFVSLCCGCTK